MERIVKRRSPARPDQNQVGEKDRQRSHPAGSAVPLTNAEARTVRLAREVAGLAARAGWTRGHHLAEQELARALCVSRTPVRAALRLLAAEGAAKAEPNRGFFLLQDGIELAPLLPEQATTADDVLQKQIIRDRVTGALPMHVAPAELAQRYGTRRTTLDRVLGRLAAEGLLTREAGQKWRFLPSLEGWGGVRASYQLRELVEPGALLMDHTPVPPGLVEEQRRRHLHFLACADGTFPGREWSAAAVFELDAAFHESVAGLSGNSFVVRLVQQQNALRRLLEFDSYADLARVVDWIHEHLAILDALGANDRALAAHHLHRHLARAASVAGGKLTALSAG